MVEEDNKELALPMGSKVMGRATLGFIVVVTKPTVVFQYLPVVIRGAGEVR